jgi:hypothetical protein
MKMTTAKVPAYAQLLREMHEALRSQNPEWIQSDGDSSICDSYESRLAELLDLFSTNERNKDANFVIAARMV